MGFAYDELGNYNKGIECYRKAIELDPKDAYPWSNMGVSYYYLGNYIKAVEYLQKAVQLEPDNKTFQENLAIALKKL